MSLTKLLPGLFAVCAIACGAVWLHGLPYVGILSALILAIALGIAVRNTVGVRPSMQPGITFALKKILRLAIVLLGLQLSLREVAQVGIRGLAIVTLALVGTFLFTEFVGRRLGVNAKLARLIAAGTSICGASAVIATNVVTEGRDEDVAYAVAMVTVFGTISMFAYPLLPTLLHLSPHAFGVWAGSSIHEIAQVVAATFQDGKSAGEFGTISKLTRIALLAPVVIVLGTMSAMRERASGGAPFDVRRVQVPWFVLGFVAVIVVNSMGLVPDGLRGVLTWIDGFLLAVSLAAMGLETSLANLRREGLRPLLLGAAAWLFIASFSLLLVKAIY